MLTIAEVELPQNVARSLHEQASFSDSFWRFTRNHLSGFRQPVAVVAALLAPLLFAFTAIVADTITLLEVVVTFSLTTVMFLLGAWFTNRQDIRDAYRRHSRARLTARADLSRGRGQNVEVALLRSPAFYEHPDGVIILAEAENEKTIFFDIAANGDDSRWFLYLNGDMHRRHWSFIRLIGSGSVVNFEARSDRLVPLGGDEPELKGAGTAEVIAQLFGAPMDGDLLAIPFEEAVATIARLR